MQDAPRAHGHRECLWHTSVAVVACLFLQDQSQSDSILCCGGGMPFVAGTSRSQMSSCVAVVACHLLQDQSQSDTILDDLSCMLGCTRSSLHGEWPAEVVGPAYRVNSQLRLWVQLRVWSHVVQQAWRVASLHARVCAWLSASFHARVRTWLSARGRMGTFRLLSPG